MRNPAKLPPLTKAALRKPDAGLALMEDALPTAAWTGRHPVAMDDSLVTGVRVCRPHSAGLARRKIGWLSTASEAGGCWVGSGQRP